MGHLCSTEVLNHWDFKTISEFGIPYDIFWESDYVSAWVMDSESCTEPILFLFRESDKVWINCFIKRRIPESDFFDIESAYGFGGPLSNSQDIIFLQNACQEFEKWAISENIICEFIRFHPLIKNETFYPCNKMLIEFNRETVFADLTKGSDELHMEMRPEFVRGVKRAFKSGLSFREAFFSAEIDSFINLYTNTMKKADATDFYFFQKSFFIKMNSNKLRPRLFGAYLSNVPIAMIFLIETPSSGTTYYFLGGSDQNHLHLRPNNFLFYHCIMTLTAEKRRIFFLGGGSNTAPENNLLRFKKAIASGRAPYKTGKKIFQNEKYQQLRELTLSKYPDSAKFKNIFQIWHIKKPLTGNDVC
ncbi:MAG: GNAT family N-acetyltransferase [Candidatus Riflebacteria bacterium]|nr:GNAT family N-acetyltransferase [Candidatus Riflebacteria bacterium]